MDIELLKQFSTNLTELISNYERDSEAKSNFALCLIEILGNAGGIIEKHKIPKDIEAKALSVFAMGLSYDQMHLTYNTGKGFYQRITSKEQFLECLKELENRIVD